MYQTTNEIIEHTRTSQEHLMLYLPMSDGIHNLRQVEFLERPATNAEFLDRLKFVYELRRSRPSPSWWFFYPTERHLSGLRFVRFRTVYTTTPKSRITIRVRVSHSLPRGEEGWASGDSSNAAACTKVMLASLNGLLDDPKDIPEKFSFYDLVPRKLEGLLPAASGACGWGLYFVEEDRRKGWYKGVVLVRAVVIGYLAGIVAEIVVTSIAVQTFDFTINGCERLALRGAVMWFVWRTIC